MAPWSSQHAARPLHATSQRRSPASVASLRPGNVTDDEPPPVGDPGVTLATVDEAVEAARSRPRSLRDGLRLAPVPAAARAARIFVREVCRSLRLELRGDRLLISVRDRGSGRLRPVTPDLEAEGGRGLWLVEQLARAWGVRPAPEGGKTVWCALTV
jgi:hypothetical protein